MSDDAFFATAHSVCDWFVPLNPYEKKGPLFKIEDANYIVGGTGTLSPLYCFAISSKRYALFNLDSEGRPVIRKASAHGLGHLLPPYQAEPRKRRRTSGIWAPKPVAPYDKNSTKAAALCFDRETRKPVPIDRLKSIRKRWLNIISIRK